jgi:hypothetical protein
MTLEERRMTEIEIESPDTQDPTGLVEKVLENHDRGPTEIRILGLLVAHADEFLGVREDPEAPAGLVYAWGNVVLNDRGKRLMGHLPEKVGSLMVNYESGRWEVQEAGEVVAEGYIPFS